MYSPPTVRGWDALTILSSIDLLGAYSSSSTPGTGAYPLANLAFFVPFSVPVPVTVRKVWVQTGATAGANFDIGVYDDAGNRLMSSGTTARVASTIVDVDTTDLDLAPNRRYYMAFAASAVDNYFCQTSAAGINESFGICEQTSAFVLPNPATLALTTRAYLPKFGLNLYTVDLG